MRPYGGQFGSITLVTAQSRKQNIKTFFEGIEINPFLKLFIS